MLLALDAWLQSLIPYQGIVFWLYLANYLLALTFVVSEIVRGLKSPGADQVRDVAATLVAREDLDQITDLALADLRNLHEGNVSRYRLGLSEYRAWQPMQPAGK